MRDGNTSSIHYGDANILSWIAAFGLSEDELKFTGLEEMVRVRYEGWPKTCAQCHLQLDYKTERWSDQSGPEGEMCLIHGSCWEEWVKRSWMSAVDALARVGIHGDQIRTLLAESPRKLSETEKESERITATCDDITDFPAPAQPQRSQIVDLIAFFHERKITLNEAYDIFYNATALIPVAEGDPERWAAPLGLSRHAATALTHVAGLEDVMLSRYQGWPTFCADCNLLLDYETEDWRCDVDNDGKFCLLHT